MINRPDRSTGAITKMANKNGMAHRTYPTGAIRNTRRAIWEADFIGCHQLIARLSHSTALSGFSRLGIVRLSASEAGTRNFMQTSNSDEVGPDSRCGARFLRLRAAMKNNARSQADATASLFSVLIAFTNDRQGPSVLKTVLMAMRAR